MFVLVTLNTFLPAGRLSCPNPFGDIEKAYILHTPPSIVLFFFLYTYS